MGASGSTFTLESLIPSQFITDFGLQKIAIPGFPPSIGFMFPPGVELVSNVFKKPGTRDQTPSNITRPINQTYPYRSGEFMARAFEDLYWIFSKIHGWEISASVRLGIGVDSSTTDSTDGGIGQRRTGYKTEVITGKIGPIEIVPVYVDFSSNQTSVALIINIQGSGRFPESLNTTVFRKFFGDPDPNEFFFMSVKRPVNPDNNETQADILSNGFDLLDLDQDRTTFTVTIPEQDTGQIGIAEYGRTASTPSPPIYGFSLSASQVGAGEELRGQWGFSTGTPAPVIENIQGVLTGIDLSDVDAGDIFTIDGRSWALTQCGQADSRVWLVDLNSIPPVPNSPINAYR